MVLTTGCGVAPYEYSTVLARAAFCFGKEKKGEAARRPARQWVGGLHSPEDFASTRASWLQGSRPLSPKEGKGKKRAVMGWNETTAATPTTNCSYTVNLYLMIGNKPLDEKSYRRNNRVAGVRQNRVEAQVDSFVGFEIH